MKRIALTLLLLLAALLPLGVAAHAGLASAEPAPGSTLSQTPPEIRLTFSEPIGALSSIMLFQDGFQRVDGVAAQTDAADRNSLLAPLPALEDGVYTVQYAAVSADGHEISGSYTFSVASSADGSAPWLILLAGALAGGIVAVFRRRRR